MRARVVVGSALLLATAVSCGSSEGIGSSANASGATTTAAPATSAPPTTAGTTTSAGPEVPGEVVIVDFQLRPGTVTVAAGETITWRNDDEVDHQMLADDETTFATEVIAPGSEATATVTTPGRYPYYCDIHNGMTGTVIVE